MQRIRGIKSPKWSDGRRGEFRWGRRNVKNKVWVLLLRELTKQETQEIERQNKLRRQTQQE